MTRIRFYLVVTTILAAMYAAVSLLDSLFWFGVWTAVASASFIAQNVVGAVRSRRSWMGEYREAVWARRESELS